MTPKELLDYANSIGVGDTPIEIVCNGEGKILTKNYLRFTKYWDDTPERLQVVVHSEEYKQW